MNTFLAVAAIALAAATPEHAEDHSPQLGALSFKSTCSRPAHGHFEAGLRWLHSFEYQEAERSFSQAAKVDEKCAIANWGCGDKQLSSSLGSPDAG